MPNRYSSNRLTEDADLARPKPGTGSSKKASGLNYKTANWPGVPGPVGPKRNTVGFKEVKKYAKQVMADDSGLFEVPGQAAPMRIQNAPTPVRFGGGGPVRTPLYDPGTGAPKRGGVGGLRITGRRR